MREYVVNIDYDKTVSELIARGQFYDMGFRWNGKLTNGEGVVKKTVKVFYSDDLPKIVSDIMAYFRQEGVREADAVELLTFCLKHPEVSRESSIVGLGSVDSCHVTECHDMYPTVFLYKGNMCVGKETEYYGQISDADAYLVVCD